MKHSYSFRKKLQRKNISKQEKKRSKIDRQLFFLAIAMTILGLIAVADVSSPQALSTFKDPFYFVKQQAKWALAGMVALIVTMNIPYSYWKKLAPYFYVATLVCLVLVLTPMFGSKVLGARRWLNLGVVSFQPSELVKLSLAMMMAWLADRNAKFFHYVWAMGMVIFLVLLQPDLGTTIVISAIGFTQLFVAGAHLLYFGGLGILGILSTIVLILTSSYRRERLTSFLSSSDDPLGASYHIRQILIALGSGGLFGVGIGQSRQKHLFLPETATDSVFAIIAEEIGFVGSLLIMILLFYFVFRAFRVASKSPDTFSHILATGIAIWIGGQIFLNISSMVALTPLTGIPLPFFSYGGSSLTMILFSVGILLNISKYTLDEKK